MGTVELVAVVMAITQFVKKLIKVEGNWAIALSGLASLAAVFYKYVNEGLAFDLAAIWLVVSVFLLANGGKKLLDIFKK